MIRIRLDGKEIKTRTKIKDGMKDEREMIRIRGRWARDVRPG